MRSICSIEDCKALVVGQGLCRKHYSRLKRNGHTDKIQAKRKCIIEGCNRWRSSFGLCALHRAQQVAADRGPTLITGRPCDWCGDEIPASRNSRAKFCDRTCKMHAMNARERSNPEAKERQRSANLRIKFGITVADFDSMLASQDDACAICRSTGPRGRGRFHVDHNHVTGEVRGLLCNECNAGLGKFRDDPQLLRAAVRYLAKES